MSKTGSPRIEAFEAAMAEAARHTAVGDAKSAFAALERAHVLGQLDFVPHLRVHWQMLRAGWAASDRREVTGQLMRIAVEKGRKARPDIELGICGEHGGEPDSIAFCHEIGLDYVSCSPFRVPVARLAAAQAALVGAERDK